MFPSDDVAETLRAMQKRDLLFIRVSEVILADAPRSVRRRVSDASRNASLDAIRGTAVTCQIHDVISVRYYNDAVASAMLYFPTRASRALTRSHSVEHSRANAS